MLRCTSAASHRSRSLTVIANGSSAVQPITSNAALRYMWTTRSESKASVFSRSSFHRSAAMSQVSRWSAMSYPSELYPSSELLSHDSATPPPQILGPEAQLATTLACNILKGLNSKDESVVDDSTELVPADFGKHLLHLFTA
ncbi:hypothetical protein EPUS_04758 [Endocarpon pusillum Z07020]|uniref:Uncharacterized protein n=1 Tax=Endocarpon pusillum (strain Z07020 / HMAS-L-300199) TaxID=1263415 RepID=U1HQK7_ENDPU|nr:uncharacterized protein EPUS_04758 [Endocarpon pusillum Z07020]ERF72705.1 hypothetical protein EPUS_04758 [Endocarpon pusillum Z07020]